MVEIHEILCPIDFSDGSRHALDHAAVLAGWYRARLTALHVLPSPALPGPQIVMAAYNVAEVSARDRLARERLLRTWLEPVERKGLTTLALTDEGYAPTRILEGAASLHADLIVMGTHGLRGFERFVIGSTTARVVRKAPMPVMTVPPAAATTASMPYKRLLCAVDFSGPSLVAFRYACSLAKEADAALTVLHVFDWGAEDQRIVERFDIPAFHKAVEGEVRDQLNALVTADVREYCTPTTRTAFGKPYVRILEIAREDNSDLIVLGVRGRNPVDLAVFGSTTNHVLQRATCPVLTLRS